jgi:pyruvate dehydrogenase E1 component
MTEKLVVPDIGDFEDVEVIEILVKEGDQIKVKDPVFNI